jgi:hypothetical protein
MTLNPCLVFGRRVFEKVIFLRRVVPMNYPNPIVVAN